MSSSQGVEQEGHYLLCGAVMFTSVKAGDAGNETGGDFEEAPRCSVGVCAHVRANPVKKT